MRFKSRQDVPDEIRKRHPGSAWVMWTQQRRGPKWLVRVDVGKFGGRMECIGVEVRAFREKADGGWPPELPEWDDDPPRLLRRTLRDLPLGKILDDLGHEHGEGLLSLADIFRQSGDEEGVADAETIEAQVARDRSQGIRARGVPDLAAIAHVYSQAKARRSPTTRAVAEWGGVSESTAAKWVVRARKAGLLPPVNPSRPSRAAKRKKQS